MSPPATPAETHVLVMCTANQCRSPFAAAALRRELEARGVSVTIESAGTGTGGAPATVPTMEAGAARGLDLTGHRSRHVEAELVRRADLVIGMERRHVREASILDPTAFPRSFTLKELVRRGEAIGPRAADESLAAWLTRVHDGRSAVDLMGGSIDDDVLDPTNTIWIDHAMMADEVESLAARLVALAWSP